MAAGSCAGVSASGRWAMCWRSAPTMSSPAGAGRTLTAAGAGRLGPAGAWHRMRTGSGTKGTRHYDWAMLEVTSDDTPDGHDEGHSVLLVLAAGAGPAGPADRRRSGQVANRGRSPAGQAGHRPGRGAGHPLEILAPLDHDLPARLHLPRRHRRRAAPARHRLRPGRRAHPDHRSRTAAALARPRHPATAAGPRPPAALVHLATTPPAPRPPSPSTLESLRRDNTMITTNYSCRNWKRSEAPRAQTIASPKSSWRSKAGASSPGVTNL